MIANQAFYLLTPDNKKDKPFLVYEALVYYL